MAELEDDQQGVQLPKGYEDATPIQLPKGYEDASATGANVMPTPKVEPQAIPRHGPQGLYADAGGAKLSPEEQRKSNIAGYTIAGTALAPILGPEMGLAGRLVGSALGAGGGTATGQLVSGESPLSKSNLEESGINAGLGAGGELLGSGLEAGLSKIAQSTPFKGIINRSIGATPAEARFADPAQSILDTTINPRTPSRLAAVSGRIKQLSPELNTTLAASTSPLKIKNLVDSPIDEGIQKILESEATANQKQAEIDELNELRASLKNTHKLGADGKIVATSKPDEIAPFDANRMKQKIGDQITSWSKRQVQPSDLIEKTYRSVYHNLEQAVSGAVPGTSAINENLSNALAARRALKNLGEREAVGRGEMAGFATVPRLEAIAGKMAPAALSALGHATPFARYAPIGGRILEEQQ